MDTHKGRLEHALESSDLRVVQTFEETQPPVVMVDFWDPFIGSERSKLITEIAVPEFLAFL
jgi:hypothetical protein